MYVIFLLFFFYFGLSRWSVNCIYRHWCNVTRSLNLSDFSRKNAELKYILIYRLRTVYTHKMKTFDEQCARNRGNRLCLFQRDIQLLRSNTIFPWTGNDVNNILLLHRLTWSRAQTHTHARRWIWRVYIYVNIRVCVVETYETRWQTAVGLERYVLHVRIITSV